MSTHPIREIFNFHYLPKYTLALTLFLFLLMFVFCFFKFAVGCQIAVWFGLVLFPYKSTFKRTYIYSKNIFQRNTAGSPFSAVTIFVTAVLPWGQFFHGAILPTLNIISHCWPSKDLNESHSHTLLIILIDSYWAYCILLYLVKWAGYL